MRLFRDPSRANGAMLHPCEVLPRTLRSLVLIADVRVFLLTYEDHENDAPVQEDLQDQQILMPDPIVRHTPSPWTLWFVEGIVVLCPTYFSQLNILGLEYRTNRVNGPGFTVANQILDGAERFFISKMQALQGTMEQKGIHFSFTQR